MFKDKLKELRLKEGLSQQELADKLCVSRSTIAKWENGIGIPSDINLEALCEFFGVEEEWILCRKELKNIITTEILQQLNPTVKIEEVEKATKDIIDNIPNTKKEKVRVSIKEKLPEMKEKSEKLSAKKEKTSEVSKKNQEISM